MPNHRFEALHSIKPNNVVCDVNKKSLPIVVDVQRNEKGFRVSDVL